MKFLLRSGPFNAPFPFFPELFFFSSLPIARVLFRRMSAFLPFILYGLHDHDR